MALGEMAINLLKYTDTGEYGAGEQGLWYATDRTYDHKWLVLYMYMQVHIQTDRDENANLRTWKDDDGDYVR
jgi:hypothetical protein